MAILPIFQIDAFAQRPFEGNPAAVCPLDEWLSDDVLQAIALENNLSETAFIMARGEDFHLRWFTPLLEVALCGHATLAAAHVVMRHLYPKRTKVQFETLSGRLTVTRDGELYAMDFPSLPANQEIAGEELLSGLGGEPLQVNTIDRVDVGDFAIARFADEHAVSALSPNFSEMRANVIATAPGRDFDFVSRFFAPKSGVDEDPVTGSAHCTLAPYWAERLGKTELTGRQISSRGGTVHCQVMRSRVVLKGACADYLQGEIRL